MVLDIIFRKIRRNSSGRESGPARPRALACLHLALDIRWAAIRAQSPLIPYGPALDSVLGQKQTRPTVMFFVRLGRFTGHRSPPRTATRATLYFPAAGSGLVHRYTHRVLVLAAVQQPAVQPAHLLNLLDGFGSLSGRSPHAILPQPQVRRRGPRHLMTPLYTSTPHSAAGVHVTADECRGGVRDRSTPSPDVLSSVDGTRSSMPCAPA